MSMLELAAEHRTGGEGPLPERAFATPVPPSEPRPVHTVHTDGFTSSPAVQEEAEEAVATPSQAIVPALNMAPVRSQFLREESTAITSSAPRSDDVRDSTGGTGGTVPHPFVQQQRRDSQLVQGSTGSTLLLVEAQSMARESRDRAAAAGAKPGDGGGVRRFSVLMGDDEDVAEGEGGARALSMQGSASFATSQELIDSLAEKEAEKKAMNKFLLLHGGWGMEEGRWVEVVWAVISGCGWVGSRSFVKDVREEGVEVLFGPQKLKTGAWGSELLFQWQSLPCSSAASRPPLPSTLVRRAS